MSFDLSTLRDIIVVLVPMILSLSVHEFAHAWSAHRLGDDTASLQGRMTLNPISHIDVFGTLLIPVFSVISGGIGLIGWAKPVPVSPHRFTRRVTMHQGMIITALAGPGSNILLALLLGAVCMALYGDTIEMLAEHPGIGSRLMGLLVLGDPSFVADNSRFLTDQGLGRSATVVAMLLGRTFALNLGLAVFNMLPVPPLDGSRVLPLEWQAKLSRYTVVVFIGFLIAINLFGGILMMPISVLGNGILAIWSVIF